MNCVRRTAVLLGLTAAVVIGSSIPASATFTEGAPLSVQPAITTAAVAAPTDVDVSLTCDQFNTYATVTWKRSATKDGVSGYEVRGDVPGSPTVVLQAGPNQNRLTYTAVRSPGHTVPVTVTTKTTYGWSTTSAPFLVTTC